MCSELHETPAKRTTCRFNFHLKPYIIQPIMEAMIHEDVFQLDNEWVAEMQQRERKAL